MIGVALLRAVLIFRYRFDSDEPQHMHVAWGWAHGLVQYRDVFDNHMPLFHLLSAPIFALTGDDVRVLFVARFAVLPLFFLSLHLTHGIAAKLYDEQVAFWTVLLLAACPPFFLGTLEYRTDDLWVVLWLGALAIFLGDRSPLWKGAAGGFVIGLAFAVSMKSTLFVISLAVATLLTFLLTRSRAGIGAAGDTAKFALAACASASIVPGAIYIGFAMAGAGNYFQYGVFEHNRFPFEHSWRVVWFIPLYFIVRPIALRMAGADTHIPVVRRRLFLFLTCAAYFTVLSSFWPMLSLESYLPFYPLLMILTTPIVLEWAAVARGRGWRGPGGSRLAGALAAIGLVAIVLTARPWKNEANEEVELITEVLSLTSPADPVMDQKGETLFRIRPYYLVLESITNRKFRLGILRDRVAEALIRTATHVVASEELPRESRRFVRDNYLPWGRLRVAGFRLPPLIPGREVGIDLKVAGRYVVVGNDEALEARIDGVSTRGGVLLQPGRHVLVAARQALHPFLIWANAVSPATFRSRCFLVEHSGEEPASAATILARHGM